MLFAHSNSGLLVLCLQLSKLCLALAELGCVLALQLLGGILVPCLDLHQQGLPRPQLLCMGRLKHHIGLMRHA